MKKITRIDEINQVFREALEDIASEDQTKLHTSAAVLQEIARHALRQYKEILERGVIE